MTTKIEPTQERYKELLTTIHSLALQWAVRRKDYDVAHDLAADVTMHLLEGERLDFLATMQREELARFVSVATRNALIDRHRRENVRSRYERQSAAAYLDRQPFGMSPEERHDCTEIAEAAGTVLETVTQTERTAYLMVAEREMSYQAVAAELEITPRAAARLVFRTRMKLRETMSEYRATLDTTGRIKYSRGGE